MKATQSLHAMGQSLWLDNISRSMLDKGTIQSYIDDDAVTGLTSNPSIYQIAIASGDYDDALAESAGNGDSAEEAFFSLALADLQRAADLFAPVHKRTAGVDGWVSLEVSPRLVRDTQKTITVAASLHERAQRPNLFVKIPGTPEGLKAIEETIFAGVPVNVTLLFSAQQYEAAADAYLRGIERRVEKGLDPSVASVASLFISRWDTAVADKVPAPLKNRLGLAVGRNAYRVYRDLLDSDRSLRLANEGARPQRLLWASTKTKDPAASDTLYVEGLAAPFTVNTMPDATLEAVAQHGNVGPALARDGGGSEAMLAEFGRAGIDVDALALQLQNDGAAAFDKSWTELLEQIDVKRAPQK